jgi:hypothetical protein
MERRLSAASYHPGSGQRNCEEDAAFTEKFDGPK